MVHVAGAAAVLIAAIHKHERPRNFFLTGGCFRVGGVLPSGVAFQFRHIGNCRQAVPFKAAEAEYIAPIFIIVFSPRLCIAPPREGQNALPCDGRSQPRDVAIPAIAARRQRPALYGARSRLLVAISLRKPVGIGRGFVIVAKRPNRALRLELQSGSINCRRKRDGPACKQLHLRVGGCSQIAHRRSVGEYRRARRVRGPTGKLVVSALECALSQVGRHVVRAGGHWGHAASGVGGVGVERNAVLNRRPLRVELRIAIHIPIVLALAGGVVVRNTLSIGVGAKLVAGALGMSDRRHRRVICGVGGSGVAAAVLRIERDGVGARRPLRVEGGVGGKVPVGRACTIAVVIRNALSIGVGAKLVAGALGWDDRWHSCVVCGVGGSGATTAQLGIELDHVGARRPLRVEGGVRRNIPRAHTISIRIKILLAAFWCRKVT